MKKLLLAAGFLAFATSAAWAQLYYYPSARAPSHYSSAPYGYVYNYGISGPEPYAVPPTFYSPDLWDYYRVDQPGRGNNVESTR